MFLVSSGSAHGHRNKNRGGKRDECGVQRYTVSEKAYKQEVTHGQDETGSIMVKYSSVTMSMRPSAPQPT